MTIRKSYCSAWVSIDEIAERVLPQDVEAVEAAEEVVAVKLTLLLFTRHLDHHLKVAKPKAKIKQPNFPAGSEIPVRGLGVQPERSILRLRLEA